MTISRTIRAGNFSEPTAWSTGVVPGVGAWAAILHPTTIDASATVARLMITADVVGSGSVPPTLRATEALRVGGGVTVGAGFVLQQA